MSMHKEPLTELERQGLENHRLPIGTPSQLSDTFRIGMRWALAAVPVEPSAWLVTGGRLYKEQVVLHEESADDRIATRSDGSRKVPLYAHPAPQRQRAGYALVPIDPTVEMQAAWNGAGEYWQAAYSAMLAATPPQPTVPAPQAQAVSQWLPIESAPKNGTEILVWWAHPTKDQPGVSLSHWLDNSKTATPWAGWALPKVIVPGMYVSHWMHKPGCPASAAQKEPT